MKLEASSVQKFCRPFFRRYIVEVVLFGRGLHFGLNSFKGKLKLFLDSMRICKFLIIEPNILEALKVSFKNLRPWR